MTGPALSLDRTRDYGTVHGEGVPHGMLYEQDGLAFNAQGELIMALVDTDEKKALVERKLRKLAKAQAKQADDAAPQSDGQSGATTSQDDDDDEDAPTDAEVNIDAWARGAAKVPWVELQKVAKQRFAKVFKGKEELVEFLVYDAKLLNIEDVAPALRPKSEAA